MLAPYAHLTRLDRPIGTFLLLWPTLWGLWFASGGAPTLTNLLVFMGGVVVMRSAGCVINDIADRKIDGKVKRTAYRPLVTGQVSLPMAVFLFIALLAIALALVLQTDMHTVAMSFMAVVLAILYPFTKRATYYPQFFLGAAFAWAVPMVFVAELGQVEREGWLIFIATLIWAVAYDTYYAMADREEDLRAGIKSIAIALADMDRVAIFSLQLTMLGALTFAGTMRGLSEIYYGSLGLVLLIFVWQLWITRKREPAECMRAFRSNHWVGAAIFLGLFFHYSLHLPVERESSFEIEDSEIFLDAADS